MAADVVSSYVLPNSFNLLKSEDMGDKFHTSLRCFFEIATFSRYMAFLDIIIPLLPKWLLESMMTGPANALLSLVHVRINYPGKPHTLTDI